MKSAKFKQPVYFAIGLFIVLLLLSLSLFYQNRKQTLKFSSKEEVVLNTLNVTQDVQQLLYQLNANDVRVISSEAKTYIPSKSYLNLLDSLSAKLKQLKTITEAVTIFSPYVNGLSKAVVDRIELSKKINRFSNANEKQAVFHLFHQGLSSLVRANATFILQQLGAKCVAVLHEYQDATESNAKALWTLVLIFSCIILPLFLFSLYNLIVHVNRTVTLNKKYTLLSDVIANAAEATLITDAQYKLIYLNKAAEKLYGRKSGEVIGQHVKYAVGARNTVEEMRAIFKQVQDKGYWSGLLGNTNSHNDQLTVLATIASLKNEQNEIIGYYSFNIDFAELKEDIEIKSFQSTLLKTIDEIVLAYKPDLRIVLWNEAAESFFGLDFEEVKDKSIKDIMLPHLLSNEEIEVIRIALTEEGKWSGELTLQNNNKQEHSFLVTINTIRNENDEISDYIFLAKDISKIKELQEQLLQYNVNLEKEVEQKTKKLESETVRLKSILNNTSAYVMELDREGKIIDANIPLESDGLILSEIVGTTFDQWGTELSAALIRTKLEQVINEVTSVSFECEVFTKRKEYYLIGLNPIVANDKVTSVICTALNITARKKSEDQANKLSGLIENSFWFTATADVSGNVNYINPAMRKALDIPDDIDVTSFKISDFHDDIHRNLVKNAIEIAAMEGKWMGENQLVSRTGKKIDIFQMIMMHKNADGIVQEVSTKAVDITELKQKSKEVERLGSIVENTEAIIVIVDTDWKFIYANKTARDRLGISADENITNLFITEFLTEATLANVPVKVESLQQEGKWLGEVNYKSRSGEIIPVVQTALLHKNEMGNAEYISLTSIDISRQKKVETELKIMGAELLDSYNRLQNVREEERVEIARDIHDELGQHLTLLKLSASSLRKYYDDGNTAMGVDVQQITQLIQQTIDSSRRIVSSLKPTMLDDLGLSATLRWHTRTFQKSSGVEVMLNLQPENINLEKSINLCVYRLVQESLTNVLRYSKATLVTINILLNSNELRVMIRDNGIGFDPSLVDTSKHHGLTGMKERVYAVKGTIEIHSKKGNGTFISVRIPDV